MTGPKIQELRAQDTRQVRDNGRPAIHGEAMKHAICVRVTEDQWRNFHDKGGSDWLRGILSEPA